MPQALFAYAVLEWPQPLSICHEREEPQVVATETEVQLLGIQAGEKYACRDCPAKCCRIPWEVHVTAEEHTRLMGTPWVADFLKKAKTSFVKLETGGYKVPQVKKKDGDIGCVFLDDTHRCTIQMTEGHEAIPYTCQSYPFGFFVEAQATEGGTHRIWAGTSFFCRSILHDFGEDLAEVIPAKFQSGLEHQKGMTALPETILLGGKTVNSLAYIRIFAALDELMGQPDLSVVEALWEGHRLLKHLAQVLPEDTTLADVETQLAAYQPETGTMPQDVQAIMASNTLMMIGLAPLINKPILQRNPMTKALATLAYKIRLFKQVMDLMMDKGTYTIWDFPRAVNATQAKAVTVNLNQPEVQQLLRRFYRHIFQSKRLLSVRSVDLMEHYFRISASYPYIERMSKFYASACDHSEATFEDIREAVGYGDLFVNAPANQLLDTFLNYQSFSSFYDAILLGKPATE